MKLKYNFEFMEIDEETVAVPIGDNAEDFHGIVKLNSSATEIFELLQNETSVERIVEVILSKYDSPRDEVESYVNEYISDLQQEGLLVSC